MLILASTSPRRKEIMQLVGLDFKVVPSNFDEKSFKWNGDNLHLPEQLAIKKANEVYQRYPNDIVIASDTIVLLDNEVLEKPKDRDDAINMLNRLQGRKHIVSTGVCIIKDNKVESFINTTEVEFYPMDLKEIGKYVDSKEPMDKAGAYGIQGLGAKYIKGINGDYYTVMGLPIAEILHRLDKMKAL